MYYYYLYTVTMIVRNYSMEQQDQTNKYARMLQYGLQSAISWQYLARELMARRRMVPGQ